MSVDEETVEAAALKLDPRSRARLADKLLASLDGLSEAEVEALWFEEAERRDTDLDTGNDTGRPAEEVIRGARTKLG